MPYNTFRVLFLSSKSRERICPPSSRVSPVCYPQNPSGGDTLGSRTLSDVASLCHSLRWCKKITAHQQLRTKSGARRSLPRRRCSSRSVFERVSAGKSIALYELSSAHAFAWGCKFSLIYLVGCATIYNCGSYACIMLTRGPNWNLILRRIHYGKNDCS